MQTFHFFIPVVFVPLELPQCVVQPVEHDAGVLRREGQAGPDPDGGLPAAAQVHPAGPQAGQQRVPGGHGGQVHGAEGAAAARAGQEVGELLLELLEAGHDGVAGGLHPGQEVLLPDGLDDLPDRGQAAALYWGLLYLLEHDDLVGVAHPGVQDSAGVRGPGRWDYTTQLGLAAKLDKK